MEQELFDFSKILNKRKNSPYYPRIADDILKKIEYKKFFHFFSSSISFKHL